MSNKLIQKIQRIGFQWEMENPFLFCAHHQDAFPRGNESQGVAGSLAGRNIGSDFSGLNGFSMYHGKNVPGFPAHPHRGFETVTIVQKGLVDHFDSKGARGRYGNGDVQWLTTGKGCQHAEMFPLVNREKENPAELFQVWLNLPSKDKFAEPSYKMLWSGDIPEIVREYTKKRKTTVRIIAGSIFGTKSLAPCPSSWANNPANRVGIFLVGMEPGASVTLPASSTTMNRNLYFYEGEGELEIDGIKIASSSRIKLAGDKEITMTNGQSPSHLLLLEGEPIQESVAQYGPFVMNTEKEIREAFEDYRRTGFGGWPWESDDPVNDRNSGRFAQYADGRTETP